MSADVAADAYVWGYPLVVMHRTRAALGRSGLGRLVYRDRLATTADRTVVGPNNDTLYASGWFDLRHGDLRVRVPVMDPPDRYWSVMLIDAYTNVQYVSRRLYGTTGAEVRITYDRETFRDPDTPSDVITIGTPTVWVLVRVLVDGPDDLPAAAHSQRSITLMQPAGAEPTGSSVAVGAPNRVHHAGASFFDELRAAVELDPPARWHPPMPDGGTELLARPPSPDVLAAGVDDGEARVVAHGLGIDRLANGWGTRSRGAAFGDDLVYRAAFAKYSLAGHLPAENRSYARGIDGSRPVVLRFAHGEEPPCNGFWSLSMYGTDMFFVDNEIDRYSVGDRTAGLVRDDDGALTITVSHTCPDGSTNWLPAPPGRGLVALRVYEGLPAVVDATWFPPDLGAV